ncbi:MAG: DUF4838 domain-containing protein [Prolixibacteraceae bacterium]|jgi:hypothetical protein|nr:DUF4838 domain-containing protein [Prolixibacteraceae bacterium]MBT6007228.1 DUF4838 domain-containing protein [Prolixibacteraceae bacterium]MBT6765903.1 DUF4838 domain-containing protein [Prolixibacteraceae bacterium]MBT6999070.1 DUF4838 domain-containing protein [Prolixibacteraceae bacterium]MBT7394851.1 DUF4838 domain-containing protein [Prolixibacteraceae bacterium]
MDRSKFLIITVFFVLFAPLTQIATAQNSKLTTGEWLQNWYLAGPFLLEEGIDEYKHLEGFENDFLESLGGETNPKIEDGTPIKYDGETVNWKYFNSPESIINLDKQISKKSFVAAYAYAEIESDFEGVFILALGSNDGGRLWFNGEQVWDCTDARGFIEDDDLIPVAVKKGKNKILLKVEERGNTWAFAMRFFPFNLSEFVNTQALFQVNVRNNGIPELHFSLRESVAEELFKSVQLEIIDDIGENTIWKWSWSATQNMVLPVGSDKFQKNKLKIKATLTNGELWHKEIPFASGNFINHTFFENESTDYVIIIGEDASESEQWAAKELQHWLEQVSGAKFPIKTDEVEIVEKEIIIGYNKHSLSLFGADTKIPSDTDETYLYKNEGAKILLLGGKERGSMYAVFSFLENEFGCRWYTPLVSVIPSKKEYLFNYINHTESPTLQVRNDFYYEAFDPIWAARNKINGAMNFREQKGGVEGYWSVHTFFPFMPPAEYYDNHPEYYSLIDGERVHERAQLCLTNPDVLDIITERLRETIRKNPEYLIYSVSQNDWRNPCQCEKCQAIAKKEGSESGPIIWFVNQVAERIKDEFPDKYVGTLAYQYTRKPPTNIVPHENVVVRFCSIECCFAHDFNSCEQNAEFIGDLEGWAAIAPHMYIWDYVVNFSHYILPYPNFKVLQSNIKTFIDNKAIGIMEQAAYQSRGGEFAELRAYLIGKLLWNVNVDVDEVIDDFMVGYYGRSGQYVRAYFDFLHGRLTPDTHIHLGLRPDDILFSGDFVREAEKIFDQAERVAENEEILNRVEMARLPIMYLKCLRSPIEAKYDGTYERFNEVVKREGITHFAERGKVHVDSFHRQMELAK